MKPISLNNVHSFCRTCLGELQQQSTVFTGCSERYNVHQTQHLLQWLEICTSLRAEQKDGLPKFVCQQCYDKLQQFHEFRSVCLRSLRILSDLLATKREANNEISSTNEFCRASRCINKEHYTLKEEQTPLGDVSGNKAWLKFDWCPSKEEIEAPYEQMLVTGTGDETQIFLKESSPEFNKNQESMESKTIIDPNTQDNLSRVKRDLSDCSKLDFSADESQTSAEVSVDFEESQSKKVSDNCEDSQEEDISQEGGSSDDYCQSVIVKPTKVKSAQKRRPKKEVVTASKKYEIKFQCEHCPRRCMSQENLDAHVRTHQGLKPFTCSQCNRGFSKSYHLRVHMSELHSEGQKEIVCSYEGCNKVFRRDASYRVHYRIKHSDRKPRNKTYICEDCGRTYKNITVLREHRYKHAPEEEYPYHCEHCGKRYISQRTYKVHLLRHAGIKNFECPHCGMKKTTRNELRTHINYHTKEKQWPCPLCPSVFNSSANLGMHDRVVHKGIRRYSCRFCEQSFGKADTLKHHEMRHTGEKPHVCEICNKGFIQPVALRSHMKTHSKPAKKIGAAVTGSAN